MLFAGQRAATDNGKQRVNNGPMPPRQKDFIDIGLQNNRLQNGFIVFFNDLAKFLNISSPDLVEINQMLIPILKNKDNLKHELMAYRDIGTGDAIKLSPILKEIKKLIDINQTN